MRQFRANVPKRPVPPSCVAALDLRFRAIHAVHVERRLRLVGKIHQLRRRALHAEREFVSRDPALNLGIVHLGVAQRVELGDAALDVAFLDGGVIAAGLSRFSTGVPSLRNITPEYFDGRKPLAQLAEPPGTPRPTQIRTTNSGRFLDSAAETVGKPGTHAGPAGDGRAGVHQQLAGHVIELVRVHRPDEADVVGDRADVREQVGELHAALPVLS
jgi:hypothetical protein